MSLKLTTGKQTVPRWCVLFGVDGIGKSTWAAQSPHHVILNFESGLHDIDCRSTERITDWMQLLTIFQLLVTEPKDMQWIVLDTLDWLEQVIHQQVAKEENVKSIADIGYGKGYPKALAKWQEVFKALEYLTKARGCGVIATAHAHIKRFDSPESESYDRYVPSLHQSAQDLWVARADEVLFASYKTHVRKEDLGFDRERAIAYGAGERYIRTTETPAVKAKSRLNLPAEIPMKFDVYAKAIADQSQAKGKKS